MCSLVFTGKAFVLKLCLISGYEASHLVFNYQMIVASLYAIIGSIFYLPYNEPTALELGFGFMGGAFDIIGSCLLGFAFMTGPGG